MVAYEFYSRDRRDPTEAEVFHLIGILPERRKNSERITEESIMNWGRIILGKDCRPGGFVLHPDYNQ